MSPMNRETFSLSQKELQRVAVISACIKGEVACARAAELLCLSVRQIKRLKKRLREDGEAALAHASRGRPSPRRLPVRMRDRILHLARTRYVGFNDHHLCEKLREVEGCSLGRETLRRLLRQNGLGSPKKRRAPTHRQRRLCRAREGGMLLLDGSVHRWLEDRGPQLTLLGFLEDATRKVPVAEFFPTEDARGYFHLLPHLLNSASSAPPIWLPPTMSCAASCPTTTAASAALPEKRKRLGARPPKISAASAASSTSASSAMTTSCNGTAAVSKSRPNQNASAS